MYKKLLLSIIFLYILNYTYAQHILKGKIVDSLYNKPVEYASVSLFYAEISKLSDGKITDSTGVFSFENVKKGNYTIKIEFIGYQTKQLNHIQIEKGNTDLGTIILLPSEKFLNEVEVNGTHQGSSFKMDKQVFKADQFQVAKGGTAIDIIKNLPSVSVDVEGNIRLRGSSGFLVLINGKPVITDANTVLGQLPANSIENVEIITAPSAKYDADGKAGIINITTKKGATDGISGVINGQIGLPSVYAYHNIRNPQRYGGDVSLNYKKKQWDISVGGSYQRNDIAGRRDGDVNTTVGKRHTRFPSLGERSFERRNYAVRASVGYAINKSNNLTAGFYHGQRRQYRRADIVYDNLKTDLSTGTIINQYSYFNSNLVKKQGDFTLANLDYSHTFQNKSVLTLSGLYEYGILDGWTKNLNTSALDRNDTVQFVYNTGRSPLNGFRGRVDYAFNIGNGKFETGYQWRYQSQTGTFLYQNAILRTSAFETLPEFSADIDIQNRIHGAYVQYGGKISKLEYVVGLRYEYSLRVFKANKQVNPFELELSNIFPSANILYTFDKGWKAKVGLSSRVQRSTNNELNPYPEREHSETLEQGDPNIKPEFIYLSESGLIKEFKAGSLSLTAYNQQVIHVVNRVNSVYNDTILNRIYTNAGNASQWGIELGLTTKWTKWWSFYFGGNVYDYRIKESLFNKAVEVRNNGLVYTFNTNQTFQLNKTLSVQFTLNYLSLRPTAQGEDSRFISPNLSVKKTFWKNKFTVTFQWQNIGFGTIPSNEQRITTWGSNFYTTTNYIQEKDVLLINLSYNFNQQNRKFKLPSSEFGEKEF